jgi:hypothetical protein
VATNRLSKDLAQAADAGDHNTLGELLSKHGSDTDASRQSSRRRRVALP